MIIYEDFLKPGASILIEKLACKDYPIRATIEMACGTQYKQCFPNLDAAVTWLEEVTAPPIRIILAENKRLKEEIRRLK